jgi:sugar O-acyltransferase (sialic acid O-acetyltransferase NeuD family)
MRRCDGLVILGCGGHARSVADVALAAGYRQLLFIDANAGAGERLLGFAVEREPPRVLPAGWRWIAAAGDGRARQRQVALAGELDWPAGSLAVLAAPTATIGAGASVGAGTFIAHHAHLGPLARVGTGVIVNTGAAVEHDCVIGDYAHVSVNATVAGRSRVGSRCFVGAGATVIDGVQIGDDITLGAGGVAIASLDTAGTYVGVPAKLVSPA